ncbi:hypothetical protein [Rouxiella sp. WC2420]|uniref:Toxin n=1 Tax=Rouxiella sp. WC2420 TaxID=3234145 RepID=A0AB39VXW1_9GAMM
MPLTNVIINEKPVLPKACCHNGSLVKQAAGVAYFNRLNNVMLLPASYAAAVGSYLWQTGWQAGDNAFELVTAFMGQVQSQSGHPGLAEFASADNPLISSLSYALKQRGYTLSTLQLLGPAATFYLLYPLISRLLHHDIKQSEPRDLTLNLARLLAGCCEEPFERGEKSAATANLTWQSQLGENNGVSQPAEYELSLGLPATRPMFGPNTGQQLYRLPEFSSAVFFADGQDSPMAFCPVLSADNVTQIIDSGASSAFYLRVQAQQNRVIYALSTTNHTLSINTDPQSVPAVALPSSYLSDPLRFSEAALAIVESKNSPSNFYLKDPLRFPEVASAKLEARTVPWNSRVRRGVVHDGLFALVPNNVINKPVVKTELKLSLRIVDQPSLSTEDQLYQMNVLDSDGLLYPLFAPPNSSVDCLSCLPTPAEPVRASSMKDMIEKAFFWVSELGLVQKMQAVERFMQEKQIFTPQEFPDLRSSELKNIVASSEWLASRHELSQTLGVSHAETDIFLSKLFIASPFEHNEELKMALTASPLAEVMLAKVLLTLLDQYLPSTIQLLKTSNFHMATLMNQTEPVTYARLEGYFQAIQDSFISRVTQSFQDPTGIFPEYITTQKIIRLAYWHQQLIEFDYPFMLLRKNQELRNEVCLSPAGILINLGVRRVVNSENIASISRQQLIRLGHDLLLNSSSDALVDHFSHLELLFTNVADNHGRGIKYTADQLKRLGVLLIRFIEAKRKLSAALKSAAGHDSPSVLVFQQIRSIKQQLYALALESLNESDQQSMIRNLHAVNGVDLQFVRLSNTHDSSAVARPYIGFLLTSRRHDDNGIPRLDKHHYFISLVPVQSDTSQPLLFTLADSLPEDISEREVFFNGQGKSAMLGRLSENMLVQASRYQFHLQNDGSLHVAVNIKNWSQIATILAREIVTRQLAMISLPEISSHTAPENPPQRKYGRVYTWFRHQISQLIYLTPLGSCKDAATDIVQGHIAPLIMDGAFCLYAFAPAGSEEEEGIKSVANVIKRVLKNGLADTEIVAEGEPVLSHLDRSIVEAEQQLDSGLEKTLPVSYHYTKNAELSALLTLPAPFESIAVNPLPKEYQPVNVWQDPLHDVLYFTLTISSGELRVYRLDEINQLLIHNPSDLLRSLIQRETHFREVQLLKNTLNTGTTQQLRVEIYQQGRMRDLEHYALQSLTDISEPFTAVTEHTQSGTRYYPGIKQTSTDSLYLIAPVGLPVDRQVVIDARNNEIHYWRDNVIYFKPVTRASQLTVDDDVYINLANSLENVPQHWTLDSIWVEQKTGTGIVVSWKDSQGELYYRRPDNQGKWLLWDSKHRDIFCQVLSRPRRNDRANTDLIAEIFSPAQCGYLLVPKVDSQEKADALEYLKTKFMSLAEPIILDKVDCSAAAQIICVDYNDIWETIPPKIREFVINVREWNINIRVFNDFELITTALGNYSHVIDKSIKLDDGGKLVRSRFISRVQGLLQEYEKIKKTVVTGKISKEEFKEAKKYYYDTYIVRNLKANSWLNRRFVGRGRGGKIIGDYIIKAATPAKIMRNYPFLHESITQALSRLKTMSSEIALQLNTPNSIKFLTKSLDQFFNGSFTPAQVENFKIKLKLYLDKVSKFNISDIVVVADRLVEGKLISGCLKTPIEKLIYGDGAYSFVYNSENDKRVYLLDYLTDPNFIEYSLSHEFGHLTFEDINYVFQEEIYLNSGSIVKNFKISGAAKFAAHLMSNKAFFLDYISRHTKYAIAFYLHFYAHTRNPIHKQALHQHYEYFLDRHSITSITREDQDYIKKRITPLVEYLFSEPNIKLNMAYYNLDIFCGLFHTVYENAMGTPLHTGDERIRRETDQQQGKSVSTYFMSLLFSALYHKHLMDPDAGLAIE